VFIWTRINIPALRINRIVVRCDIIMFYLYEEQIIELVKQIIKKYESALHLVVIYGSFARQQHTPNSDLDLLIVGDENVKKQVLNELANIYVNFSVVVSTLFYSWDQYQKLIHHPFIKRALKEGIVLWEKRKI